MELSNEIRQILNLPAGMVPSTFQCGIWNWAHHGEGNAIIIAVAGSGKTTTGEYAVKCLPVGSTYIFLAFNVVIATELKARGINASTFNSAGAKVVGRHFATRGSWSKLEANKLRLLCDRNLSNEDSELYENFIVRLVDLGRQLGIGTHLLEDTASNWLNIIDEYAMMLESESADIDRAVMLASRLLQASNDSCREMIDFTDQIYQVAKCELRMDKLDYLLVDEAQDTNAIQRYMIKAMLHEKSRCGFFGDPAQAIYAFRGADSKSMQKIKEEFGCIELPLTISYRCAKSIVEFAKQWCSHIEASPTASEGEVKPLEQWDANTFERGDIIGCRNNAPLITLAYKLLRARKPAYILGKVEISATLVSLIKRMKAKGIDALQEKLSNWAKRETAKCQEVMPDGKVKLKNAAKIELINDKVDCITCLIESLVETDRTVPSLIAIIEGMFKDENNNDKKDRSNFIVLGTIHKLKGLEAKQVYWLNKSLCPSKWAMTDTQREQERNLQYVMATRAKHSLYLIEDGSNKAKE